MGYSIRRDYILNRWTIIAAKREERPRDYSESTDKDSSDMKQCPFCPGNEEMTPPATLIIQKDTEIRELADPLKGRLQNWIVRCIPNMYPALQVPKKKQSSKRAKEQTVALGFHEVVIETPNHNETLRTISFNDLALSWKAILSRAKYMMEKPFVRYVAIFKNSGKNAGASQKHPHTQIISTPIIPPLIKRELEGFQKFIEKHNVCPYCEVYSENDELLISETTDYAVVTPWASIYPYEFWIIPKDHNPNMFTLKNSKILEFVVTLKKSLVSLQDTVGDIPFNFYLHTLPKGEENYHWHIEVYPKLGVQGGFELGTDIHINSIPPNEAASQLRRTWNKT